MWGGGDLRIDVEPIAADDRVHDLLTDQRAAVNFPVSLMATIPCGRQPHVLLLRGYDRPFLRHRQWWRARPRNRWKRRIVCRQADFRAHSFGAFFCSGPLMLPKANSPGFSFGRLGSSNVAAMIPPAGSGKYPSPRPSGL